MITVNVTSTSLTATADKVLTEGLVGELCVFTFDESWDGLAREAIFEGADVKSKVLFTNETEVPPEVFAEAAGYNLRIAVTGKKPDGTIVIPTIWGKVSKIQASAEGSEYSPSGFEPTPDIVAQIETTAANALLVAQQAPQAAVDAVDEVISGKIEEAKETLENSVLTFATGPDGHLYMRKVPKLEAAFAIDERGHLVYV